MTRMKAVNIIVVIFVVWTAHGRGNNRAISRSNNRNVIATRKNFIENGSRAELVGSKPHSYGFAFSEYRLIWGNQNATKIRISDSVMFVNIIISKFITLFWS